MYTHTFYIYLKNTEHVNVFKVVETSTGPGYCNTDLVHNLIPVGRVLKLGQGGGGGARTRLSLS